ncbi:MAG: isocitrate/isopropylmalate dehydrogenase family protein [Thermoplasmata archaeon]|nr:isocitrate/isopropylmalate dehydrogenase family protein [Thermoplasmata archaeon]
MAKHRIACLPGDGVGPEVIMATKNVLEKLGDKNDFVIEYRDFPNGAEHYLKTGEILSDSTLREIGKCDAILLGALGDPRVKPGILEKGILLKIRFAFDQFINHRPVRFFPGVATPISSAGRENLSLDFVRENTEDFYVGLGRRFSGKKDKTEMRLDRRNYSMEFKIKVEVEGENESAYQIGIISRSGAKRVIKYAFDLARRKEKRKLTGVDKANVITEMYGLWRDAFHEVELLYPDVETEFAYVDAVAMNLIRIPERYSVLVTPNLFGDILTDLGAGIQGSLGLSPSGNINPDGVSMFEPVHGSAPDIAGKGIANPIAALLAAEMMLTRIGEKKASEDLDRAIHFVLAERRKRTPDIGGNSKTDEVAAAIIEKLT